MWEFGISSKGPFKFNLVFIQQCAIHIFTLLFNFAPPPSPFDLELTQVNVKNAWEFEEEEKRHYLALFLVHFYFKYY